MKKERAMDGCRKGKHIVLAGVGPATLEVLKKAEQLHEMGAHVTVLHDQPFWFFENMIADIIGGDYQLDDFRFDIKRFVESGRGIFLQDKPVSLLRNQNKILTDAGRMLHYDVIIFENGAETVGEEQDVPVAGKLNIRPVHHVLKICNEIETLLELFPEKVIKLVVLGGNTLGVEYALNIQNRLQKRKLHKRCTLKIIEAQARLVKYHSEKVSEIVQKFCLMSDIEVLLNREIEHVQSNRLVLSKGETLDFDLALLGYDYKVPDFFSKAGLATNQKGAVFTDYSLRIENEMHMFAVGSCAQVRDCYRQMRFEDNQAQGLALIKNLKAWLGNKAMIKWRPPAKDTAFLSLGDDYAVLQRGRRVVYGKWCQTLRRYRDKRYMKQWLQMLN